MVIESIDAISASESSALAADKARPNFIDFLDREISSANEKIAVAEESVQKLALGEAENLHQVMISLEKAKTAFELVVQVRNKLLEGYQEIMRMQV